jgi:hypothetical protein
MAEILMQLIREVALDLMQQPLSQADEDAAQVGSPIGGSRWREGPAGLAKTCLGGLIVTPIGVG